MLQHANDNAGVQLDGLKDLAVDRKHVDQAGWGDDPGVTGCCGDLWIVECRASGGDGVGMRHPACKWVDLHNS